MSSIIKVNTYQDANGNALFSSDGSGNVSGNLTNVPAFIAQRTTSQTLTDNTWTKVAFNNEVYDSDGYYDATTNYRFTPLVAGKYFLSTGLMLSAGSNTQVDQSSIAIYKNGSYHKYLGQDNRASSTRQDAKMLSCLVEANGTTDYFEVYVLADTISVTPSIANVDGGRGCFFSGYKLGGA